MKLTFLMWLAASSSVLYGASSPHAERILKQYDQDGDGSLNAAELTAYFTEENRKKFDENEDGTVTSNEVLKTVDPANKASKFLEENPAGRANALDLQVGLKLDPAEQQPDLFDRIGEHIDLRKSFLVPNKDATDPARLSWIFGKDDSSYAFDGALSLDDRVLPIPWTFDLGELTVAPYVSPTVEAHVSNEKSDSPDSVSFGVPVRFLAAPPEKVLKDRIVKSYDLALTPVFETDSDFDVKTFTVNPTFTLSIPRVGIGRPFGDNILFMWRPYVGFELGRVLDDGDIADLRERGTISRFLTKSHAELFLTDQFRITADVVLRQQMDNEGDTFLFGEISPQYFLNPDENVAVGVTFKSGRRPPKFEYEHAANLWVGLKF